MLVWDEVSVWWRVEHFRNNGDCRVEAIARVTDGVTEILTVALDGPIRRGFDEIGKYRACEQMLTRGLREIGKPGQASSAVGRRLNVATNEFAEIVLRSKGFVVAPTVRAESACERSIVEAFPTSFLGVMLSDPSSLDGRRGKRSDSYFIALNNGRALAGLVGRCLDRPFSRDLGAIQNHDDRAAMVCALTALCVVANDYVAVGDDDGWIVLPPRDLFNDWAFQAIKANERESGGTVAVVGRSPAPKGRLRDAVTAEIVS